jgi:Kef-type K+ transport system membrane component KefB
MPPILLILIIIYSIFPSRQFAHTPLRFSPLHVSPQVVCEILVGVVLGPEVLNYAPRPKELSMYGQMGLLLLVLEAGLIADVQMLRIVGPRSIEAVHAHFLHFALLHPCAV